MGEARLLQLEMMEPDPSWRHKVPRDPVAVKDRTVHVSMGGPHKDLPLPEGSSGWNAGDIDFREDGAIFIRNPYLADAIEKHLRDSFARLPGGKDGERKFLLRIVRDEGWSGTETNIVCT
jgi:hypothetical protein